jgi:DNA-binding PadR family transcriptional regulator
MATTTKYLLPLHTVALALLYTSSIPMSVTRLTVIANQRMKGGDFAEHDVRRTLHQLINEKLVVAIKTKLSERRLFRLTRDGKRTFRALRIEIGRVLGMRTQLRMPRNEIRQRAPKHPTLKEKPVFKPSTSEDNVIDNTHHGEND